MGTLSLNLGPPHFATAPFFLSHCQSSVIQCPHQEGIFYMHEMLIATPRDLTTLAERVLADLRPSANATVLALHGELGAGKTAFTQTLASMLGVRESVTSPTFVVMRLYPITADVRFRTLVHIDAYRIASLDELRVLGFDEILVDPANLICIEWAGQVAAALPRDAYHITLTPDPAGSDLRTVVYGYGAESA